MKETYEKIKSLAEEINETHEDIAEDGMSVIVGLANCNDGKIEVLTASGETEGVLVMLHKTARQIGEFLEDEKNDTNFS